MVEYCLVGRLGDDDVDMVGAMKSYFCLYRRGTLLCGKVFENGRVNDERASERAWNYKD